MLYHVNEIDTAPDTYEDPEADAFLDKISDDSRNAVTAYVNQQGANYDEWHELVRSLFENDERPNQAEFASYLMNFANRPEGEDMTYNETAQEYSYELQIARDVHHNHKDD